MGWDGGFFFSFWWEKGGGGSKRRGREGLRSWLGLAGSVFGVWVSFLLLLLLLVLGGLGRGGIREGEGGLLVGGGLSCSPGFFVSFHPLRF